MLRTPATRWGNLTLCGAYMAMLRFNYTKFCVGYFFGEAAGAFALVPTQLPSPPNCMPSTQAQ